MEGRGVEYEDGMGKIQDRKIERKNALQESSYQRISSQLTYRVSCSLIKQTCLLPYILQQTNTQPVITVRSTSVVRLIYRSALPVQARRGSNRQRSHLDVSMCIQDNMCRATTAPLLAAAAPTTPLCASAAAAAVTAAAAAANAALLHQSRIRHRRGK